MSSSADDAAGISNLVHGNERDARELRANLAVFARQTDNRNIRRLVSEVLAGHRNVREVFRTPEFAAAVSGRLDKIEQGLAQLTDEERARVFDPARPRTAQSTLDAMRDAHDPGGPLLTPEGDGEGNENRTFLTKPNRSVHAGTHPITGTSCRQPAAASFAAARTALSSKPVSRPSMAAAASWIAKSMFS
jgi:hypothetical protein